MSDIDLDNPCLPGRKVCDNVCIEESLVCCPADSPELDNAGGCQPDQTCIFNGCCDIGDVCLIGGGVKTNTFFVDDVIDSLISDITAGLPDVTEPALIEETAVLDDDDDDDDDEEEPEPEVEAEEATEVETEVVAEETGSVIGGGIDDDDDDEEEVVGNPGGNVNTVPTRSDNTDAAQSTDAAPSNLGQNGVAKKALLGLGLFALLAL